MTIRQPLNHDGKLFQAGTSRIRFWYSRRFEMHPAALQLIPGLFDKMRLMKRRTLIQSISAAALLPATTLLATSEKESHSSPDGDTVYELRIYHCFEGKLPDLLRRFREHTTKIFERHSMKNIAYWTPIDEPQKSNTLVYILQHPSREAAAANWKAFSADPEWQSVQKASEANGKIVEKVDSTFLVLTDFSPILR